MPEVLKEISGISVVDDSTVFCEQDELGVVFRLNLKDNSVSIVGRFTDLGDFEDVQTIQNNVYVLRSDGALLYFDYTAEEIHVQEKMLKIPCLNMEGLCYNKTDHYLYIACKDIPFEKYNTNFENRYVYKVNPSDYTVQPYLQVDQNEIRDFIDSHYNIDLSLKPILQPSALAFHPQSNFLYVLSADNRLIAVYDENDKLCNVLLLPPEEYYKPEGIDFMPNGDLLISSEGMKKGYLQGQVSVIKPKQND